jgi:hypothetical protein
MPLRFLSPIAPGSSTSLSLTVLLALEKTLLPSLFRRRRKICLKRKESLRRQQLSRILLLEVEVEPAEAEELRHAPPISSLNSMTLLPSTKPSTI